MSPPVHQEYPQLFPSRMLPQGPHHVVALGLLRWRIALACQCFADVVLGQSPAVPTEMTLLLSAPFDMVGHVCTSAFE
eukprot:2426293-Pyramimonas_sp.AAC.1